MVKTLLLSLLLTLSLVANEDETEVIANPELQEEITKSSELDDKIRSFISKKSYTNNKKFIKIIFSDDESYFTNDRVDDVKVIETLKENGLLKLFFKKPQELRLTFKTSGYPLFFVKIMGDTLRNIGYYRYVTIASNLNSSEFTWAVAINSEYATDPLILQKELLKSASKIIEIKRNSQADWEYTVDMQNALLNVDILQNRKQRELKRSPYPTWLNVSDIEYLKIKSSKRNSWYPKITYYDSSLHLLKVVKKERIYYNISLKFPKDVKYIKISDTFTLKNLRNNLILTPIGSR